MDEMSEDEFIPSDSEDEYSTKEKLLLEKARTGRKRGTADNEEAVFGIEDSGSENDLDDDDIGLEDMDSDLDHVEDDDLPDVKAWGKKKKGFYNTDYVDPDFGGTFTGKDAALAEQEEEEARNIQKRLADQLFDSDFVVPEIYQSKDDADNKKELIDVDLTKLSKRQKIDLLQKESPEFQMLVEDFTTKMTDARETCVPILNLVKNGKLPQSPAVDFVQTKYQIILNYCTNIMFYIMLKTKRTPIKDHPVIRSLFTYRQLLEQLEQLDQTVVSPQVENILKLINTGTELNDIDLAKQVTKKKQKKKLKILQETTKKTEVPVELEKEEEINTKNDYSSESEEEEEEPEDKEEEDTKRAITYQMAKNKGLTPKRKKEQRNPRVKHRNKYRKAKIRRRGQVREARKEIPYYGGEPTGIKIGISKSIKIK